MSLLAWRYDSTDEDVGAAVVAGATRAAAAEAVAGVFGWAVDEVDEERVQRAPEFDKHATEAGVPLRALWDAGWTFTCQWCEHRIDNGGCEWCDEGDEDKPEPQREPMFSGDDAYCSQGCLDSHLADKARFKAERERIRRAGDEIAREFPGLILEEWASQIKEDGLRLEFRAPGLVRPVHFELRPDAHWSERRRLWLVPCDLAAWHAFAMHSKAGRTAAQ